MPEVKLASWQRAAIFNPWDHFAMWGGVGVGKSYSGTHYALKQICEHPDQTGLIGANTYDQLSQATLREFFYWLEHYGFEFIIDSRPPKAWGMRRALKDYKNTISVRNPRTRKVTLIFTRVMSEPNALRGIEISWYWLDETRDMAEEMHDVVLSRIRETPNYAKGLITTTPNGEDWSYKRFFVNPAADDPSDMTYGSLHVATIEAVKLGILSHKYYDTMLKSYSPMMALQELEAKHVNVFGGRAYYASSERNKMRRAPWGDEYPDRGRPLVIGCDFNFSPAPCVWMVGQVGPAIFGPDGVDFSECIHWFGELSAREIGTVAMAHMLLGRYPGYFYQIFGDASGGVGTTSNAGKTDYDQISETLSYANAMFSINYFQDEEETRQNPKVKTRVENMNRLLNNAVGESRMTYDPVACPLFDGDMRMVGWKETTAAGRGKLDDGGDKDRTHGSDGAGYAMMKIFPPGSVARLVPSVASPLRSEYGLLSDHRG